MSKFDYCGFSGGYDSLAVSKEKHTKEEAIEIAKVEIEMCVDARKTMPYIAIGNGYVRHRAGMNEDNEPCVGWWIEYEESKRSCPCFVFHNAKSADEFRHNEYEYINVLDESEDSNETD